MRARRRHERLIQWSAVFVVTVVVFVPARAVAGVLTQTVGDATQTVDGATQTVGDATQTTGGTVDGATQTVGDATQTVGDATQTVGDATQTVDGTVDGATQTVGDTVADATQATGGMVDGVTQAGGSATQTVGGAIGAGTTSGDGATGETPSGRRASATSYQGVEPGPTTVRPTSLGIRRLATSADAERDVLIAQGGPSAIDEQGDPCDENQSLVCLGLLYGLGGFESGGAKVLGILVTTGAAVIGLMIVSLGLGLTGSTLVAVSARFATRPAD